MLGILKWLPWLIVASTAITGAILGSHSGFSDAPFVRFGTISIALIALLFWWFGKTIYRVRLLGTRSVSAVFGLGITWMFIGLISNKITIYIVTDTFFYFTCILFFLIGRSAFTAFLNSNIFKSVADGNVHQLSWTFHIIVLTIFVIQSFLPLGLPIQPISPSIVLLQVVALMTSVCYSRDESWLKNMAIFGFVITYVLVSNRAFLAAILSVTLLGPAFAFRGSIGNKFANYLVILTVLGVGIVLGGQAIIQADTTSALTARLNENSTALETLQSGGNIDDLPTSIQQRLWEAQLVESTVIWKSPGFLTTIFGYGFGVTLDMSQSKDDSVLFSATLGAENVHNIHLLPYMILLHFGFIGILLMLLFIVSLVRLLFRISGGSSQTNRKRDHGPIEAIYITSFVYVVGWLIFSIPAAAFIYDNPMFWIQAGIVSTYGLYSRKISITQAASAGAVLTRHKDHPVPPFLRAP